MPHFIYMHGTPGCMPDSIGVSGTLASALEDFDVYFGDVSEEITDAQVAEARADLARDGIVYFSGDGWGAQYAEISECDCAAPWEHCGSDGQFCTCFGCEARAEIECAE
jgi:hypothetical protein